MHERLSTDGGELLVVHGTPKGAQLRRADAATAEWAAQTEVWNRTFRGIELKFRPAVAGLAKRHDVVVMELEAANLNAWYWYLRNTRCPIVLWGHGKSYTAPERRTGRLLEVFLARQASHVMTYTADGREELISAGLLPTRVTAVGNANDSRKLRRLALQSISRRESILHELDLSDRVVALYVGGLDADKRIDYLLAAAEHARVREPRFLLVIGGSGELEDDVRAAEKHGAVRWIPRFDQETLARYGAVAEAIWMPGRIGLVAVDSLALGLPVISADYKYHAPEVTYLRPGRELFVFGPTPAEYAESALALMHRRRTDPQTRPRPISDIPTVESVVDKIVQTVATVALSVRFRK
ncbi:glycosyltransferase [Frankia sp. Cr2]|uniref:glycosyltransferase n=1 Tax=Frankia sp. Cr2 TaxID=3073932 RepID=UPI002AD514C8|nr:glycosyltransferase [Frankia sp. Cr2]